MVYFFGFFLAFLFSVVFTKVTIRLAVKYGFVDDPRRRHGAILHTVPIPRAGGVPVYVATLFTTLIIFGFYYSFIDSSSWLQHLIGIFLAGLCIVIMGLVDDKYDL